MKQDFDPRPLLDLLTQLAEAREREIEKDAIIEYHRNQIKELQGREIR